MRIRFALSVSALLVAFLAAAPGASAATEIGSTCTGNANTSGPATIVGLTNTAGSLPLSSPSAGVITKWTFRMALPVFPAALLETLKVLRPLGGGSEYEVAGESAAERVGNGIASFDARIPVQAGDRVGLYASFEGSGVIIYCEAPANSLGYALGNLTTGSRAPFATAPVEAQVPVSATVEPDADNDGFGDETQDKCPLGASTQAECPVIVLDSFALAKKASIVVLVAASESASVSVGGTAKLPKGAKKASASAKAKLKKVKRNVTAGKLARFTLKLPAKLKSALRGLPKGRSITVKLTATATNVAGQVSKDKSKLKLKG
jgi:hypothetical protein